MQLTCQRSKGTVRGKELTGFFAKQTLAQTHKSTPGIHQLFDETTKQQDGARIKKKSYGKS
jgi:hypothetical protein